MKTSKLETSLKKLGIFESIDVVSSNAVVVKFEHGRLLQHYGSIVAIWYYSGEIYLTPHHDYSKTTIAKRNKFLNSDSKTVDKELKDGIITMLDTAKI